MEVFTTNSPAETKNLAPKILKKLNSNVIGLIGELGSGKTTFTQGLAKTLGVGERVISPSFMLIRQYDIPKSKVKSQKSKVYHVDLYRLNGKINVSSLGLEEIWDNPKNLVIIEWAEKIKKQLPEGSLIIEFEDLGGNMRKIVIR